MSRHFASDSISDFGPSNFQPNIAGTNSCEQPLQQLGVDALLLFELKIGIADEGRIAALASSLNQLCGQKKAALECERENKDQNIKSFFCNHSINSLYQEFELLHDESLALRGYLNAHPQESLVSDNPSISTTVGPPERYHALANVVDSITTLADEGMQFCRSFREQVDAVRANPRFLRIIFNEQVADIKAKYKAWESFDLSTIPTKDCPLQCAVITDAMLQKYYHAMSLEEGEAYVINLMIAEARADGTFAKLKDYVPEEKMGDVCLVLRNWNVPGTPIKTKKDYRCFANWAGVRRNRINSFFMAINEGMPGFEIPSASSLRPQKGKNLNAELDEWVRKLKAHSSKK